MMMSQLTDAQLLAYLSGEATPEVIEIIEKDGSYQDRLDQLDALSKGIVASVFRAECPSSQEIGDYYLGLITLEQKSLISTHLKNCPLCSDELNQLKTYLGSKTGFLDKTKIIIARLIEGLDQLSAQNNLELAPVWDVRGREKSALVFQADEYQIVLMPYLERKHPSLYTLTGLLAGQENLIGDVDLMIEDCYQASSRIDELGNFSFEHVEPGVYKIIVDCKEIEIHSPTFSV